MRKKYSKSGARLPITRPVVESQRFVSAPKGKTAAGCAKVKGMLKDTIDVRIFDVRMCK
jgi:hypothetical protein